MTFLWLVLVSLVLEVVHVKTMHSDRARCDLDCMHLYFAVRMCLYLQVLVGGC